VSRQASEEFADRKLPTLPTDAVKLNDPPSPVSGLPHELADCPTDGKKM
jgi:hypothetical protein